MSVKFSVKMNEKYMYDFFLYNTYMSIGGVLTPIIGGVALAMSINTWVRYGFNMAVPTLLIAILFLVVNPITLKSRSAMQVRTTPMFQKPLEYEIDKAGITVRQDDAEALNKWEDIAKVVSTRKSILVYLNRVRAIVLPKECIGEQYGAVTELIRANVPAKKVRLK